MEYELSCDICCVEFDEALVPKMLDCGHSFCVSCIWKLVESIPNCPQCRKELNENKKVQDYPTNYSLLNSLTLMKQLLRMNSSVQIMKNRISVQKEYLDKKRSSISSELEITENNLIQLQELTNAEDEIIDMKKAEKILDDIESIHKMKNLTLSDLKKLKDFININLCEYEDSDAYLLEIFRRLQNEEKIYAVKNLMDSIKYGKITVQNNAILFHALSEKKKPEKSLFIWFDDLKKCVTELNFFTFIKLSINESGMTREVKIKMLDSQLASNFIALCTGECGSSYIGCKYNKYEPTQWNVDRILEVDELTLPVITNTQIDYNTNTKNNKIACEDTLVVCYRSDKSFSICKMIVDCAIPNIAGIVKSPSNLKDIISFTQNSKLEIVDCGIILKL